MLRRHVALFLALLLLAAFPLSAQALTFRTGDIVEIAADTVITDDLYVAARELRLLGRVEGDLVVAAEKITVSGEVRDDVIAAARVLDLQGSVGESIRAAGETLTVSGSVGRDLILAGRELNQTAASRVAGAAILTGRDIAWRGRTAGELRARAATVLIDGELASAEVRADDLTVTAGARIAGPLTYFSSQEADIRPGATLQGPVTHREVEKRAWRFPAWLGFAFLFMMGSVTGVLLALLMPRGLAAIAQALRQQALESAAIGAGIFFGTPLLAAFLMITLIGFPLGLTLLLLYGMGLYVAWVLAAVCLGIGLLAWAPLAHLRLRVVLAAILGVAVLLLLQALPWVGGLLLVLALIAGFGGATMALVRALRPASP